MPFSPFLNQTGNPVSIFNILFGRYKMKTFQKNKFIFLVLFSLMVMLPLAACSGDSRKNEMMKEDKMMSEEKMMKDDGMMM